MLNKYQLLKIKILANGITITGRAKSHLTANGKTPLSLFEYPTTAGISIVLPENIYVNAQFIDVFSKSSIILDYEHDFLIKYKSEKIKVNIIPLLNYYNQKSSKNIPYTNIVYSQTDRLRVSPITGCYFNCKYCNLNLKKYSKYSFRQIKEAIDVVMHDKNIKPKHILISGGTPRSQDRAYLDLMYKKITAYATELGLPTDVMLSPCREKGFLIKLRSWGVNALAINLEIYNPRIAKALNPEKAKISWKTYSSFIKDAVKTFGMGHVRSGLIVGLESIADTLEAVDKISKLGCDVVFNTFVPGKNTPLEKFPPPTEKFMIEVYEKSKRIAKKNKVVIGPRCIPCQYNSLAFPENNVDYFFY